MHGQVIGITNCSRALYAAIFVVCAFLLRLPTGAQSTSSREQDNSELQPYYALREKTDPATMSRIELLHHYQEVRISPDFTAKNYKEDLLQDSMGNVAHLLQHVLLWNKAALDMTALDHTVSSSVPPVPSTYAEQFGPVRTSRAMAMVHLALFEALNTVQRRYTSYHGIQAAVFSSTRLKPDQVTSLTASEDLAVEESAFWVLAALYPNKQKVLQDNYRTPDVEQIRASIERANFRHPERALEIIARGSAIGKAAAAAVLADRTDDGSQIPDLHASDFSNAVSPAWMTDPLHPNNVALGSSWHDVRPFVLTSNKQFLVPPPPAPYSEEYKQDLITTGRLGGDPNAVASATRSPTRTDRTREQTFIGVFWGYDGTALLCAPPRLYNMIATSIATRERIISDPLELARLLASVNVAMADAGIAGWTAKYTFLRPRPVTAIRAQGDDLALWTPLGAPQSNSKEVVNFTPPFPTYPSGHAVFGGALFQSLRDFYGTWEDNDTAFTFVSDEFNGVNRGADGVVRPLIPRHFRSFQDAELENGWSRVYLGIHLPADLASGIALGNQVGTFISTNLFKKLPPAKHPQD